MKKIFAILVAVLSVLSLSAKTLYLQPNSDWKSDGARFAVYAFGSGDAWYSMTAVSGHDGYYQATVDDKYPKVIFCRMNGGAAANNWDNKWNQTQDMTVENDKDLCTISGWDNAGAWSKYVAPEPDAKFYITGDSALVVDAGLDKSKAWNATAIASKADSYTFKGLKANVSYQLKVVTTSSEWKGYSDLTGTPAAGLYTYNGGNICFRLSAAGDVVVNYTSSAFTLSGSFKAVEYMTVKFVPGIWSVDEPKYAAWIWGRNGYENWSPFFSGTGDTLSAQINADADSIIFVRCNPKLTEPKWNNEEEKDNVYNEAEKTEIDKVGLTYSITGWGEGEGAKSTGTWKPYIPEVPANFYITGEGEALGNWDTKAIKSTTDTYTLSLAAGTYQLKVTVDGTWETAKGYDDLTVKADGLHKVENKPGDNNIGFELKAAGNVYVTYTSSVFKLEGDFYVKQYENKIVKFVPSEEWASNNAKFAAWTWGAEQDGTFSVFFAPISEGNDTLSTTIKTSADSIEFVRFSPKASAPTWEHKADAEVLVWNKLKDTIDWKGLTASIEGWNTLSWKPVSIPCTYGLLINGVYKAGKKNVSASELEYKLLRVDLNEGDQLKVHDDCNGVNSVYDYESGSYDKFTKTSEMYIVNADGIYDFYIKVDSKKIYISKDGFSTTAVPNECEAVLMQAFFNESYKDDAPGVRPDADYKLGLGNTRWSTLTAQAAAISKYFDYVWLPPSANGDGMGYHPKNYGNQSSTWGSAAELAELISTLHAGGAKVVADIVINHCASTSGWIGFPEFDFGKYGKFQPKGSWICANDEVNTDPKSDSKGQATGPNDDGDNWNGARDWAHSNVEVQDMFKAYLQWMREEVGYDGFRYDKGDGFNNWHHDNYNKTAGPEIAFMECYSNTDDIQWRIGQANGNLMALDFDTKWHVFNNFQSWNYTGGYNGNRGNGLLGRLDTKHAVLFIDSHDWFLRDDNENEFGGRGNSLTPALKARLLAANAYMLSMPGVPCVFYPHWKKYQTEIEALIAARKWAGVHSESGVSNEQIINDGNGYQITVEGKHGYLILCLGTKAHQNFTDNGYKLMASYYAENDQNSGKDGSYQVWVNRCKNLTLENGYYLVGNKYNWTPVEERMFIDGSTEGEYVLHGVVLADEDSLKVVRVEKDEIVQWYPQGDNYVVDAAHEGTKTVYFRPASDTPIYIEPNHGTFIEETNELPAMKAEKFFENGKMYIRLGDKVYDVLGQTIK